MPEDDAQQPDRTPSGATTQRLRADPSLRPGPARVSAASGGGVRRRAALAGLASIAAGAAIVGVPTPADGPAPPPAVAASGRDPRFLSLVVSHTGETFADVLAEGERPDEAARTRLNRLLRDYSSGEIKAIDPALFALIARIHAEVGQPLRVLSGYRSWRANRFLWLIGHDVAENSQHVAGKAVDFTVPGVAPAKLGEIARRCGAGGIGVYRSGFVHVDTGPVRAWTGA
jgi:uncharacterized protein YcbK (DUF882 family)